MISLIGYVSSSVQTIGKERNVICSDNIQLILVHKSTLFHFRPPLDSLLYRTAGPCQTKTSRLWMSPRHSGLQTFHSWVVLSSGPVWSRLFFFPASGIKLSFTLQMGLFGFNYSAFLSVFLTVFKFVYFCWSLNVMLEWLLVLPLKGQFISVLFHSRRDDLSEL